MTNFYELHAQIPYHHSHQSRRQLHQEFQLLLILHNHQKPLFPVLIQFVQVWSWSGLRLLRWWWPKPDSVHPARTARAQADSWGIDHPMSLRGGFRGPSWTRGAWTRTGGLRGLPANRSRSSCSLSSHRWQWSSLLIRAMGRPQPQMRCWGNLVGSQAIPLTMVPRFSSFLDCMVYSSGKIEASSFSMVLVIAARRAISLSRWRVRCLRAIASSRLRRGRSGCRRCGCQFQFFGHGFSSSIQTG